MRPTIAQIDAAALRYNIKTLKALSKDMLFVAVKANGYGHGDVTTALACEDAGADFLGVATIEEGIHLRECGIDLPILVIGGTVPGEDYRKLALYELSLTVYTHEQIAYLGNLGEAVNVHLKIDTGMGRIGIRPEKLDEYLSAIASFDLLYLEGISTHLAQADEMTGEAYTQKQLSHFEACVERTLAKGFCPIVHVLNSAGTFAFQNQLHFRDGVRYMNRVGISAYGYSYVNTMPSTLKKVMTLLSQVVYVKTVHKGESVSYGSEFTAQKDTVVATVPIGYADGYKRSYSGGYMLVQGKRAKVLGRVCMDHTMIDVTGIPHVEVGTEVTVMGSDGEQAVWADDLAKLDGTINYEVLTSVSYRVPRVVINEIND